MSSRRSSGSDSTEHEDAPLDARLLARVRREGRLTFRDWMAAALYDERGGYYSRPDLERWGRAGDYRTTPERTPLFAATFARYFARLHEELWQPEQAYTRRGRRRRWPLRARRARHAPSRRTRGL